jgi:SAM-dependent methyltransferase
MDQSRTGESEKLARSWNRHEAAWLRDYLVSGVEDPRINVQSVLSRHFLIENIVPGAHGEFMRAEFRFAAAINCLLPLMQRLNDAADLEAVLHALKRGADNAEGMEIPSFVNETFSTLPAVVGNLAVPNYIEGFLSGASFEERRATLHQPSLNTFCKLWNDILAAQSPANPAEQSTLLEPACGSANDYRFLDAYGIGRFVNYLGFDISEKNVANARALFPAARFEVGNVFDIAAPDKAFDFSFVHDLFEHLSLDGMQIAVREVCRVTRRGICVGFFSMDETADHIVREVEEYHWNTLSMARMRDLFAQRGFAAQVIQIGTFLRQTIGCEFTHNPNAYTFMLRAG